MLRRAASTLNGHAAAWLRRIPRRPLALLPAQLGSHLPQAQLQPRRGVLPLHVGGARGYARMARRLPPTRPDGYSTSEGEVEDPYAREFEESPDPYPAAAGEEGDDDSEGSEEEGFMWSFPGLEDGSEAEEEGADDEGGK